MNKASLLLTVLALSVTTGTLAHAETVPQRDMSQQSLEKIAPYPGAQAGMTRQAIFLPPREHEENFRVELLIGKMLDTDCNHQSFGGKLENHTLSGWGYDYITLPALSGPTSTLMACPNKKTQRRFITANLGDNALQRYNSRLPLVVYVPEGVQVKYRVWSAGSAIQDALQK